MTFSIASGQLRWDAAPVRQIPSPNHSGAFRVAPHLIVMHYTAGGSAAGSASWLARREAGASAHLIVDRDGTVIQCVNLADRAWHAGRSSWQGLTNLNAHAIGIELANWGPLTRADGEWRTAGAARVPYLEAAHRNGGPVLGWERYPDVQIETAKALARAIATYHPITQIVGHDDIAPGRKRDPGPAFDMARFRKAVLGKMDATPSETGRVTARRLNVRAGPGLAFPTIDSLARGQMLPLLERHRDWIAIGPGRWVFAEYIA